MLLLLEFCVCMIVCYAYFCCSGCCYYWWCLCICQTKCSDILPEVFFGELWFLLFVRLIFLLLHMPLMFELGQFILFWMFPSGGVLIMCDRWSTKHVCYVIAWLSLIYVMFAVCTKFTCFPCNLCLWFYSSLQIYCALIVLVKICQRGILLGLWFYDWQQFWSNMFHLGKHVSQPNVEQGVMTSWSTVH